MSACAFAPMGATAKIPSNRRDAPFTDVTSGPRFINA